MTEASYSRARQIMNAIENIRETSTFEACSLVESYGIIRLVGEESLKEVEGILHRVILEKTQSRIQALKKELDAL